MVRGSLMMHLNVGQLLWFVGVVVVQSTVVNPRPYSSRYFDTLGHTVREDGSKQCINQWFLMY